MTSVVRVGIVEGEYHWHSTIMMMSFLCAGRTLFVDLEDRSLS